MRILVVDDEVFITMMLKEYLGGLGHHVDLANGGLAGLSRASDETYDAVVLDVRMPDISGIDVFHALREGDSPLADRVVFVCGDLTDALTAQIEELGRPVLAKPFDLAKLLRALMAVAPEAE